MRNKKLDILNGAHFFIKNANSVATAKSILQILMMAVEKHPNENWVDALSAGQTQSKDWLISSAVNVFGNNAFDHTTCVGGWVGTLPFAVKARGLSYQEWVSVDISQSANDAAETLNPFIGFKTSNANMYDYKYTPGLVINTACEHIDDISSWLKLIPSGTKLILQSNNMFEMDDHVNCIRDKTEFVKQTTGLVNPLFLDTLKLPWHGWERYMLIGEKR